MVNLVRQLKVIGACKEAMEWAKGYGSLKEAWEKCERGDWMLWLCGTMEGTNDWPTRQQIVLAACDCAELVLPIYEKQYPNDDCVRKCIAVTRQWVCGEASIDDVLNVRRAAADAAYAAYAAAADAADAAAAAADAAYYAAAAAADAAYYAAADAAYAAGAKTHMYKECADICRKQLIIPDSIKRGA